MCVHNVCNAFIEKSRWPLPLAVASGILSCFNFTANPFYYVPYVVYLGLTFNPLRGDMAHFLTNFFAVVLSKLPYCKEIVLQVQRKLVCFFSCITF